MSYNLWSPNHLKLYFVVGTQDCDTRSLEEVLQEALAGGVTMVQFREKGPQSLTGDEKIALGRILRDLCHAHHVPFIVNDDLELAVTLEADGIHVGQEDLLLHSASHIRERIGPNAWLGISAHDVEEALAAKQAGADYLGVGPMYPTSTKKDIRAVGGPPVLAQIRKALPDMPIVGIAGIDETRIAPVLAAGADGVAVVSALSRTPDPRKKAASLLAQVHKHLHTK